MDVGAFRRAGGGFSKAFAVFSVLYFAVVAAIGLLDFDTLQKLSVEDGLIEWITANSLLTAWLLAILILIRQPWRTQPCCTAAFFAAGLCLAWGRELAWGRPFIGRRLWYSRNLFHARTYVDRTYFARFGESQGLAEGPAMLYTSHLVFTAVVVMVLTTVCIYLFRHRGRFLSDLKALHRRTYGRYFLLGLGTYVVAQIVGRLSAMVFECDALASWHEAHHVLGHRVIDEPIELWGAMCFLASVIMLWRRCFGRWDAIGGCRPCD